MLSSAVLAVGAAALVAAQAPSYAPIRVDCPSDSILSDAGNPLEGTQQLPQGEQDYISRRRSQVLPNQWQSYLQDNATGSTGYDAVQIAQQQPNLQVPGIAVSGGGLRASLFGAGTISALDSRNSSTAGGLLQLATYLTGVSGGSWTTTSIALNDLEPIYSLVLGINNSTSGGWLLDRDILAPGGIISFGNNGDYYDTLEADVRAKADAGFPISLTDLWGRALSYHFLNETNEDNFYSTSAPHDQGTLFSAIKYTQNFQSAAMPLPILVTTSRVSEESQQANDSTTVIPLENVGFEISPYSFGSFEPGLAAYIPTEYLGTQLDNGQPTNRCVQYFDNAGFAMGSSASLFNAVQESFAGAAFADVISYLLQAITDLDPPEGSVDLVANYPNSFMNYNPSTGYSFQSAGNEILQITDGGEDGQNVGFMPLLVRSREVDVIFAIDGSADTSETYANGTSLIATSDKSALYMQNFTAFPPIPSTQQDFLEQGLTTRPTFFGCNSTTGGNMSETGAYPLVIYHPNHAGNNPGATNYSTFKLSYEYDEVVSFLDAAHELAMRGYPSPETPTEPDEQWPLCLKCAVVDRARARANINRTAECQACMDRYCWSDGIADSLINATNTAQNNTPAPQPENGATSLGSLSNFAGVAAALVGGLALLA